MKNNIQKQPFNQKVPQVVNQQIVQKTYPFQTTKKPAVVEQQQQQKTPLQFEFDQKFTSQINTNHQGSENLFFKSLTQNEKNENLFGKNFEHEILDNNQIQEEEENHQNNKIQGQTQDIQKKTKLVKKVYLEGFRLVDLVWLRKSEGKYKYQILVRYVDPENKATKRSDGSYQKIIKFGQKGIEDYVDPPYNEQIKQKNINKFKTNINNPLHPNFYVINLLNGNSNDIEQNFRDLKVNIFKQ